MRHLDLALATCVFALAARPVLAQTSDKRLMSAIEAELERSFRRLKNAGPAPLYFLAYRVYDSEGMSLSASNGALDAKTDVERRSRRMDVEVRVGSPALDNTHRIRTPRGYGYGYGDYGYRGMPQYPVPIEDDEATIRAALWSATDQELKRAQKKLTEVKGNRSVTAREEDSSGDFTAEKPATYSGKPAPPIAIDRAVWEARARTVSAVFREEPAVQSGSFSFGASRVKRTYANTEGTRIQDAHVHYRVTLTAWTTADDGMNLWLYDDVEVPSAELLPGEPELLDRARRLSARLRSLRDAPLAEPYAGPAILQPKAAAVFFHEVFGHRMEGHRQKREDEGRTFKGKIGTRVMPEFISVLDDPTREKLGSMWLNGSYVFDDEGVRARSVTLIDRGVLKSFLMSRSPIDGFPASNGHGRGEPGMPPVARQGNLIVQSGKRVPREELRKMLIEEIQRQQKPYGLSFEEIEGGFTMTQVSTPQAFKILPLRVFKVFADGKPDQEVRGVDVVGTPLSALERIIATGDDEDVFNGTCGAESGGVPVSASSPSLLVGTIETERREKGHDRPPILPDPMREAK